MTQSQRTRVAVVVLLALVAAAIGVTLIINTWFDPGDKNDTTTDLVTPTIAAETARVFDVSAKESQIEFVTSVSGAEVQGVFPVEGGTITLEPVGDDLRVLVRLNIHVDAVDAGNIVVERAMRGAMTTGDYPLAFYVASSTELVPVTDEEIAFTLEGTLEVNNVPQPHSMAVRAQLVGNDMWAIATSDLDLSKHDVEFPPLISTSTIKLTAKLQSYETDSIGSDQEEGIS